MEKNNFPKIPEIEQPSLEKIETNTSTFSTNIEAEDQSKRDLLKQNENETKSCFPCIFKGKNKPKEETPSTTDKIATKPHKEEYPKIMWFLDNKIVDTIFVLTSLISILLYTFSEGFLIKSRNLWAAIHIINALYTLGIFIKWAKLLIIAKYSKRHNVFNKFDVLLSILSIIPFDLIVLTLYLINEKDIGNNKDHIFITLSRLNYLLRIRSITNYFSLWENQLVIGNFKIFILRMSFYVLILIHISACLWHRVACDSFSTKHFEMTLEEATLEVCPNNTWVGLMVMKNNSPLLNSQKLNLLATHYFVSFYWSINTVFRLGYGDIEIYMGSDMELIFAIIIQFIAWIFTLAIVSGTLTSLLIETDTERENFLIRRFAIQHYLKFARVGRSLKREIKNFYDYLWEKRRGKIHFELIANMPLPMKSEIFYNVNKFFILQLPLFTDLDTSFLMNVSIYMRHVFRLKGEILFYKNEIGSQMYYLLKGYLEILDEDDSKSIINIRSGSAIREINLLHPYPQSNTIRCGSDCDILVLSREDLEKALMLYPQYKQVLQNRLQTKFEQAGLILSLCEKHKESKKASEKIKQENKNILKRKLYSSNKSIENDFDGMELRPEVMKKMGEAFDDNLMNKSKRKQKHRNESDPYYELEGEVHRAINLSKDLGIQRPPLHVSLSKSKYKSFVRSQDSKFVKMLYALRIKSYMNTWRIFYWKLFVSLCFFAIFWYYPYMFAWRSTSTLIINYYFHIIDLVFALDFFFDMIQIVVAPHRTIERFKNILVYRLKTKYFYLRLFAFIPVEYLIVPILRLGLRGDSPYFYIFKLNRFIEVIVLFQLFDLIEVIAKISPIILLGLKFLLSLLMSIHIFSVLYGFALNYLNPNIEHILQIDKISYEFSNYWSTQMVVSTGIGDIPYIYISEAVLLSLGVIIGAIVIIYAGAKISAILANRERRRISFKQTYYSIQNYMKKKLFSKELTQKVTNYYDMQWHAHEGVLTPLEKKVIWDAPDSLIKRVNISQALKFVYRLPFVQHEVQHDICTVLRQYFVPSNECVLYPKDRRREFYIIVEGFCNVLLNGELVGILGRGKYFGLLGLINGLNNDYQIVTKTHCQFFCLAYDDFMGLVKKNPYLLINYYILRGEGEKHKELKEYLDKLKSKKEEEELEKTKSLLYNLTNQKKVAIIDENVNVKIKEPEIGQSGESDYLKRKKSKVIFHFIGKYLRFLLLKNGLKPHKNFWKFWVSFRIIISFLITIFTPLQAIYSFNPTFSFLVMLIFDLIAWIDLYLNLNVSFYGIHMQLITDTWMTAKNYLKSGFLLDLFASFPFDYIAMIIFRNQISLFSTNNVVSYNQAYQYISILRLNRCLQFYRIILAGRFLEHIIYKSLTFITLLQVIPLMFLFLNYICCLAVLIVCNPLKSFGTLSCTENAWLTHGTIYDGNRTDTENPFKLLIVGLYWTISTALNVGYGDIFILDEMNRHISNFIIICGVIVGAFISSKLTACMVGEDTNKIAIQQKMSVMIKFLDEFQVSREVQARVKESYFNKWEKTKGIFPGSLFVSLCPTLKADVTKHLYGPTLRKCPLLKDLDEAGIRMLSTRLREMFYSEGEYILRFGDLNQDIFIVSTGIVVEYNSKGEILGYLGPGSLIGEFSGLTNSQRINSIVAGSETGVYTLSRQHFLEFLNIYPNLRKILEDACFHHFADILKSIDENAEMTSFKDLVSNETSKDLTEKNKKSIWPKFLKRDSKGENKSNSLPKEKYSARNLLSHDELMKSGIFRKDPLKVSLNKGEIRGEENEKWWSMFISFGKVSRDEFGAIHIIQERKKCNLHNFVIHPASPICSAVSFCLLLTCISCAITSFEISFTLKEEIPVLTRIRYILETFFIIRIFGNFHLAYLDEKTSVLVVNFKKISLRYIKNVNGLLLDLLSTIPLYLFSPLISSDSETRYLIEANVRGLQLLRLFLIVRYLKDPDTEILIKTSQVKIFKISIILCFIFHFCACIWYLVACYGLKCSEGSWMASTLINLMDKNVISHPDNVTIASRYYFSLFYVTTSITFTGLGNITAKSNIEIMATICILFATIFVIGFLVGEMTQYLASQVAAKIHYQHQLKIVEDHFYSLGLKSHKLRQVGKYLRLLWQRSQGMSYTTLMADLPYSLKTDIAFEIFRDNLKNSQLLGNLEDSILRQLSARIKLDLFLPGTHIIRRGDVCESICFIKKGEVLIRDESDTIVISVLRENDCFGEIKILTSDKTKNNQYSFSYISKQETEIGILSKENLELVLKYYPEIYKNLQNMALSLRDKRVKLAAKVLEENKPNLSGNQIKGSKKDKKHKSTQINF